MNKKVCQYCGKEFKVSSKHPNQKFCSYFCSAQSRVRDLTGNRFGKLLVISRANNYISPSGKQVIQYLCKCDCGNEKIIRNTDLLQHHSTSCGCAISERPKELFKKHGDSNIRLYKIWIGIKARCYYSKDNNYKNYGQRGITVCKEWLNEYKNFKEWSLNNGYTDKLTIDRIDVNGNYEPDNCRWVNQKAQQNNRRNNHLITYNQETHTIAEWENILNMPKNVLWKRLVYHKWDIERAFTQPVKNVHKKHKQI